MSFVFYFRWFFRLALLYCHRPDNTFSSYSVSGSSSFSKAHHISACWLHSLPAQLTSSRLMSCCADTDCCTGLIYSDWRQVSIWAVWMEVAVKKTSVRTGPIPNHSSLVLFFMCLTFMYLQCDVINRWSRRRFAAYWSRFFSFELQNL